METANVYDMLIDTTVFGGTFLQRTFGCWAWLTSAATESGVIAVYAPSTNRAARIIREDTNVTFERRGQAGATRSIDITAAPHEDNWAFLCFRISAIDDAKAWVNTTSATNTQATGTGSGVNNIELGDFTHVATSGNNDEIAEIFLYGAILTDAEVATLAAGYSPLFVRPDALAHYNPMFYNSATPGTPIDWRTGDTFDVAFAASSQTDKLSIIYPDFTQYVFPEAAAPVGPSLRPPLRPYEHNLVR
jgi:hypothetical protein